MRTIEDIKMDIELVKKDIEECKAQKKMAEQRLIDSNVDVSKYVETWECNCSDYGVQNVMAVDDISTLPEIDPETLPIVRQLRAELERVTEERDEIKRDIEEAMKIAEIEFSGFLCEFCAKNPFCVKCNGPEWRGVEKEE